jgi:hypothetical protein
LLIFFHQNKNKNGKNNLSKKWGGDFGKKNGQKTKIKFSNLREQNRQKFRCQFFLFFLVRFWAFLGKGTSNTP